MHCVHKQCFIRKVTQTVSTTSFILLGIRSKVCSPTSLNMSSIAKSCYLRSVENPNLKIELPHEQLTAIGRNETCQITDAKVSRKQMMLKADYNKREVKCVCNGTNYSGFNGFALLKERMYTFTENARLEVLLGTHFYDLIFEPIDEKIDADDEPAAKRIKLINKESGSWELIDDSLLVYTPPYLPSEKFLKMAGFDMDGTVIKTKSGARFPINSDDWALWSAEIKPKFKELYEDGYLLVIFSNQLRLGNERSTVPKFKEKVENIVKQLELPIFVQLAMKKDIYRKPAPGMWHNLIVKFPKIHSDNSFYVGDAAGREKNWAPGKKKDHSIADRLFSINLNLKFYTPEEFFLKSRKVPFKMPDFDPKAIKSFKENIPLNINQQEVIIMTGCQGSGKSHFCQTYLSDYVYVNRDQLRSKEKCFKLLEESLQKKKSVVVDNTHPTIEARKEIVNICKKYNVPCKCFFSNIPVAHARHNCFFRALVDKTHDIINDVLIHSCRKKFEQPTLKEGFSEVYEFHFNPKFNNADEEKLYRMYLLES